MRVAAPDPGCAAVRADMDVRAHRTFRVGSRKCFPVRGYGARIDSALVEAARTAAT